MLIFMSMLIGSLNMTVLSLTMYEMCPVIMLNNWT